MADIQVMFRSPEDMTEFIRAMAGVDADVDIKHGSIDFDAKSAEGIYTLPLNKKLICTVHESKEETLRTAISRFIV